MTKVNRLFTAILAIIMAVTMVMPTYATSRDSEVYSAKTAYVTNVDKYGSNVRNESLNGKLYTLADTPLLISQESNKLTISGTVNDIPLCLQSVHSNR